MADTIILITRVQQRVRDTAYSSAEIVAYLNDTQNDIFNEYRLPFMEATQNYTLNTSTSDITNGTGLPANYVQAINLLVTTSGQERRLPFLDIREVDKEYPDPDDTTIHPAGPSAFWYIYGQTVRVFPKPDQAYTVTLRYYKKPTLLADNGDVPEIPTEFEELLVVGAAYRVLQVKDNYDQAGVLENKYGELLQKLVVKYSQHQVGQPTRVRINRRAAGKLHF